MCGLPLSTLGWVLTSSSHACLRCAFLSRLRCVSVGTECSTSPPPRPARVTRAVRRASSALGRSGPSRRYQFLRLLLLLQFDVRFTPFRVCGPLLLTSPSLHWSVFLHSAALQKTLEITLSLRPTSSVKVLSSANWLTSSGMSTSTTLARIKLRLRDHLLKMLKLQCASVKQKLPLKNKEHSGSGAAKASPSGSVHKTPFTSKSFTFILLRKFALFPISGIRFRTSGKRRKSSLSLRYSFGPCVPPKTGHALHAHSRFV